MPIQPLRRARSRLSCSSHILTAIILLTICWQPARSGVSNEDLVPSMFSFNGFGTLGLVHSSDKQADFVSNALQSKGAGFTNAWSGTPDTTLGIQLNAAPTDRLSAVVQVKSQYQYGTFAGKSPAQVKPHWTKTIFTGRGQPPKSVPNSIEVRTLIAANPQAISYIERSAIDSTVKVLVQP
jgi:hypothetical protein